jgi:RND superfamily putative drug exporter
VQREVGDREGVTVGGLALAAPEIGDQVQEDLAKAELIAFPLLFLLSLWVFRGVVAALMPLLVGVLTILGTFLGLRIANEVTGLSIFALNISTALGLGLSVDYALFILSRYREEVAGGAPRPDALRTTLRTAGRTVIFSSLTVAAAMLALLVFPQRFLYSMGLAGALTALVAGAVSLLVLPSVLMLLGDRIDALSPRRRPPRASDDQRDPWYRLARGVMRRPLPVALLTAALLLLLGLPFTGVRFTGVDASVLPADSAPREVDTALRTEFPPGGADPVQVVVRAPASEAAEVRGYASGLGALPGAAGAGAPQPLRTGGWRIDVRIAAPALDPASQGLVDRIRAADAPGPVLVGGATAAFVDQQDALGAQLPLALGVLAVTTLVILFVMTGSVVLPVKALVMNVLSISAAFGLLVLVFQDGRLEGLLGYTSQGALESTQPLVLLAAAFGLSTDYGVFLLTRIKEARDHGATNEEAVALGLQRTGRLVTAAALLLTVALAAFATSEIIFIKQVGLGTAAAVIIDASIVRALLVPSLMRLLGEWNWWAPAPLRRLVLSH